MDHLNIRMPSFSSISISLRMGAVSAVREVSVPHTVGLSAWGSFKTTVNCWVGNLLARSNQSSPLGITDGEGVNDLADISVRAEALRG